MGVGVLTGHIDIANARLAVGEGVATLTASRVSRTPVRQLRLVEAGVYWSVDLLAKTVHRVAWGDGTLDAEPIPVTEGDALQSEHDAFLAHVRGEAPFPVRGTDGLAVLQWTDEVRDAIATSVEDNTP